MTLEDLMWILDLKAHPKEGGFYVETYRSAETVVAEASVTRVRGPASVARESQGGISRNLATAIYYLLTPDTRSALHRLPADEIFHFYMGDPVEMLLLSPDGTGRCAVLGTDLRAGMRPQIVVPRGVWQGSRLQAGGSFALMGTTMAPGYAPGDFEAADLEALARSYPSFRDEILAFP